MSSETNDNLTNTILIVLLVIIGISLLVSFVVLVHHFTSAAGGPSGDPSGGTDPSGGPSGGTDPSGGPSGGTDPSGSGSNPPGTSTNGQTCVANSNCVSNNCTGNNTYTYNYLNSGTNYTYNINLPTGAQFIQSQVASNDTQWFIVYIYQLDSLYYYGITGPTFSGSGYPVPTSNVLLSINQVLIANDSLFIFLYTDGTVDISIENTYISGSEGSYVSTYDPLTLFIPSLIDNGSYLITTDGTNFTVAGVNSSQFILTYDPDMDITMLVYCPTSSGNYVIGLGLDKSSVLVWNIDQNTSSIKMVLPNTILSIAFYITSGILYAFVLTDEPKLGTVTIGELNTLVPGSVDIQELDMDVSINTVVSYGNGDSIFLPGTVCT